jgi:hypothetical protein
LFQLVNLKLNSKKCNIYFTVYQSQSCGPSMSLYNLPPNKTRKLTRVKVSLFHHVDLYPVTGLQNWFCLFYTFILHFRIPTSAPTPTRQATTEQKEHDQEHAPANNFTFHRRGFGQCRQLRFLHLGVLFIFCKIINVTEWKRNKYF